MREEIEQVVKREGWSKASLDKMYKLDSFLKESQRFYALGGGASCPFILSVSSLTLSFSDDGPPSDEGLHVLRRHLYTRRDVCRCRGGPDATRLRVLRRPGHLQPMALLRPAREGGRLGQVPHGQHRSRVPSIWSRPARLVRFSHPLHPTTNTIADDLGSPGRFFAANELKLMLAHLVINYDIKAELEGVVPPYRQFGQNTAPDTKARVLFRKHQ